MNLRIFIPLFVLALQSRAQYEMPGSAAADSGSFQWPEGIRGALSLSFDDARSSQLDAGLPILDRYGVKVTFYVSPGPAGERLEAWRAAQANGHEIGNHTINHPCSGNFPWARHKALEQHTLTSMAQEIDGASSWIEDHFGRSPRSYAYPCGQKVVGRGRTVRSTIPLVAERFVAGRGWLDEGANDPSYCDLAQIYAMELDGLGIEDARALIDDAADKGLWLVFAGHEIGAGGRQTTLSPTLEAICRYAGDRQNGIWIAPVAEIAGYISDVREGAGQRDDTIETLLSRMTLEEKIGQINMPCVYLRALGGDIPAKRESCRRFAAGELIPGIGPAGGFFTLANNILPEGPAAQARYFNELQRIALEQTRLGIPLLQVEEGTHGLMCAGGTIFPEGPALGSTWNPDLLRRIYAAAALEASAIGVHALFTLVVEPNRDPRLGRNQEGYSEDAYLCSVMARAVVEGVQGADVSAADKVVAGLCHYPGQSRPFSGLERGAMQISERMLRRVFLPPWIAGIKTAGALGVMATYPAIDGVPAHASSYLLTHLLRGELGFEGVVLSEGGGIETLVYEGLAPSQREAGALAIHAGVDIGISYESGYMLDMIESVRDGDVPMAEIDRAVRRVLGLKKSLGLFDSPYVDPVRAAEIVHNPSHQQLALSAARESVVLLKNEDGLLPLDPELRSVAVIGPNADHARNQLGDYTSKVITQEVITILDGIRERVSPGTRVSYVQGCDVIGEGVNEIDAAAAAARQAEAVVLVLGENEWGAPDRKGTSGEGYDSATLELTGLQPELFRAVLETGTPVVVVLINGRPLAIPEVAARAPALLEAWVPGESGGRAVAEVLFGDVNPSGRLPVTLPRHAGQLPVFYDAPPSKSYWIEKGWGVPYADLDPLPVYPFGYGLSYTRFDYLTLNLMSDSLEQNEPLRMSVEISNIGPRAGAEVVQVYLRDRVSSVTTPVKRLAGFAKVELEPGETKEIELRLAPQQMALLNRNMDWVVEPGEFDLMVGSNSQEIRLREKFVVLE